MIYVPKNLPKKYSAIFIYAVSLSVYNKEVTTKQLIEKMRLNNTQHTRKLINDCIQYMIEGELVVGRRICQNRYELYRKEVDLTDGSYYSVEYDDIDKIINIEGKYNRLDLVDYYIVLSSTINHYTKVGYTSIEVLSERCGVTPATICKYNKVLKDNKIIFIMTSRVKGLSNRYGMYRDRHRIYEEARRAGIVKS